MRVFIVGAGKVGVALARAVRRAGWHATLRPMRGGLPSRALHADLVVLAVRERQLDALATALACAGILPRRAVCVHTAGSLDAEPLARLRSACAGVAQMHPMISFASTEYAPTLARGNVHIQGDPAAVRRATALARRLGMTPRTIRGLDTVGYHAAAGLVANGAAALAAAGAELLVRSGVPADQAPRLLGPLLRSVAENVEELGFPRSLTGPVRRGDASALQKHLDALRKRVPAAVPLFLASGLAQLPLARALPDAPPEALDAVEALLRGALATESS
jgi:predicted short-subunit dehydrogenase-like oxidoreductase (DUF2520 family)